MSIIADATRTFMIGNRLYDLITFKEIHFGKGLPEQKVSKERDWWVKAPVKSTGYKLAEDFIQANEDHEEQVRKNNRANITQDDIMKPAQAFKDQIINNYYITATLNPIKY